MKKLLMLILAAGMFATACKKEDEKIDPIAPGTGSFTVDGNTYIANEAYWTRAQGLMIMNTPKSNAEVYNTIVFYIDSLTYSSKFEFMRLDSPDYSNKKNFSGVEIRYNLSDAGEGVEINMISAGTLSVSKTGALYTLEYDLTINGKAVKGTYSGKVSESFPE